MSHELRDSYRRGSRRARAIQEQLVGRTISGVIARAGREGEPPVVLLLQFEDGGAVEFVTPRADRLLRAVLREGARPRPSRHPAQLALAVV